MALMSPKQYKVFAGRWADGADDHPHHLCEEYEISFGTALELFGEPTKRNFAKKFTSKEWKALEEDWFNPFGPTADEIAKRYNISLSGLARYLPRITKARDGRTKAIASLLTKRQLQELTTKINSGEFTTYTALTAEYPPLTLGMLSGAFGSPDEIKKRVVDPNCPPSMSKTQFVQAKARWQDTYGGWSTQIAKDCGVTVDTLKKAFGKRLPHQLSGRRGSFVGRLDTKQLEELIARVHSGEFTTFSALAAEYPPVKLRTLCRVFGSPAEIKKRVVDPNCPPSMSKTQFDQAKARWQDTYGGWSPQHTKDFGVSLNTLYKAFGKKLPNQLAGRQASFVARLDTKQLEELIARVNSGEFTTFSALAAEYPPITLGMLKRAFGSPAEIKKRVVDPNCPPSMSKTQFDQAKARWQDTYGDCSTQIAKDCGVSVSTLYKAFGKRKTALKNKH